MVMSKKHRQGWQAATPSVPANTGLFEEYVLIKRDLYKIFAINILFLGAMLALYYTNRNTHYLDNWFSQHIHLF